MPLDQNQRNVLNRALRQHLDPLAKANKVIADMGGRILRQHETVGTAMLAPGRVVLVERGDDYVTWWQNLQDGGLYFGHYFDKANENAAAKAQWNYDERVAQS